MVPLTPAGHLGVPDPQAADVGQCVVRAGLHTVILTDSRQHASTEPTTLGAWTTSLHEQLDTDGVAVVEDVLTAAECAQISALFDEDAHFRSTVDMARHAYGRGRYRYFADPLPPLVAQLRTELYPDVAQVANGWAERLGERTYPATHEEFRAECAAAGQRRPTPLLLRYGPGDHNRLHQDVYGDLTFPLQLLVMLSRPDEDFTGGESVFVEQRARQQSLPRVLRPTQGSGGRLPGAPPARAGQPRRPPRAGAPRRERRAQRAPRRAGHHLPRCSLNSSPANAASRRPAPCTCPSGSTSIASASWWRRAGPGPSTGPGSAPPACPTAA